MESKILNIYSPSETNKNQTILVCIIVHVYIRAWCFASKDSFDNVYQSLTIHFICMEKNSIPRNLFHGHNHTLIQRVSVHLF